VFEQASVAWHELFQLPSHGSQKGTQSSLSSSARQTAIKHSREASQQLTGTIKRERTGTISRKISIASQVQTGLERFYGPGAQPRSEGQASALKLVHQAQNHQTLIIVLPTSSGKSVLFYSVAALVLQQTVIVVVPFTALVADLIVRGQAGHLDCQEWLDETSSLGLPQLLVVSADRAVSGPFLHHAKGLELRGQLAHIFFDECHVAFTDISYRKRLQELWALRYLNCPFTCLTATLLVQLEPMLRSQLLIPHAKLFRRNTARPTIRYQVIDSLNQPVIKVTQGLVERLVENTSLTPSPTPSQRGIIYVRSYATGEEISTLLNCPFYKAQADAKDQILERWIQGHGGWIVATGALGTGISIDRIRWIIHVGRPYGLTSFAQQSGRGGRNGEISDSYIVTSVAQTHGKQRRELLSEYSVEQVDEDSLTEYIQSTRCRRSILGRYLDGILTETDCLTTDSVLCDWCEKKSQEGEVLERISRKISISSIESCQVEGSGQEQVQQHLQEIEQDKERVVEAMVRLQGGCIFCELVEEDIELVVEQAGRHEYIQCSQAQKKGGGREAYERWRKGVRVGGGECKQCGLSKKICRREEGINERCLFPEIGFLGFFVLFSQGYLEDIARKGGFRGEYSKDVWQWMLVIEQVGGPSYWSRTWDKVCKEYLKMVE
jgi:superfamily II DNA helicase RecQ